MYYVVITDEDNHLHILQKGFSTLDNALSHAASLHSSHKARVMEEVKNLSQRVVFRPKPKAEPVWRELAVPSEPLPPNGMERLGELLREKISRRKHPLE
jgi:hypothetical protein